MDLYKFDRYLKRFRTSAHLSHLRTQKTLEQLGAAASEPFVFKLDPSLVRSCRVGREDVLFQMDVWSPEPVVFQILLDASRALRVSISYSNLRVAPKVLREYVPVALPLMLANVLCPSVLPEEVEEAQQHAMELQQIMEDPPSAFM